jgi:prepilin-type processing-associated H-X9-DG protein
VLPRTLRVLQFTVIELLVILAVVSILASLMIPAMGNSRDKARMTACTANLGALGQSLLAYQKDHNNQIVTGWDGNVSDADGRTFWTKLKSYYKDDSLRKCPANPEDKLECYGLYDALSGKPMATTVPNPVGTVYLGENTQLEYDCFSRDIAGWTRASTGHWELGYAHSFTSDTPTTQWSAKRPINPFVHRPLVNLLFCDGHVASLHYMEAWGGPYKHGDPKNIWDNK